MLDNTAQAVFDWSNNQTRVATLRSALLKETFLCVGQIDGFHSALEAWRSMGRDFAIIRRGFPLPLPRCFPLPLPQPPYIVSDKTPSNSLRNESLVVFALRFTQNSAVVQNTVQRNRS